MMSLPTSQCTSLDEMVAQYEGPDTPLPDNLVTVMIRNIPKRYTADGLLIELAFRCILEECCLLHLPCSKGDFNIGYAFVTFSSAAATQRCFYVMSGQSWMSCKNSKTCRVVPARLQGVSANLEQYVRNLGGSRFLHSPHAPLAFHKGQRCDLMKAVRMHCGISLYEEMRQKCLFDWEGSWESAAPGAKLPVVSITGARHEIMSGEETCSDEGVLDDRELLSSTSERAELGTPASSSYEVPLGTGPRVQIKGMIECVSPECPISPPLPYRLLRMR